MKRMNKKGFTIVELVIVIAVIAILAAVLIPTFSGIITKAQESAAMQVATAAYKEAYATVLANDGAITAGEEVTCNNIKFTFGTAGNAAPTAIDGSANSKVSGFTLTYEDGSIKAAKTNSN